MNIKNLATSTLLFCLFAVIIIGCGPSQTQSGEAASSEPETKAITLTKAPPSPAYDDASLSLTSMDVTAGEDGTFSADFAFEVGSYDLGVQTEDAATRGIANSGKGQHIHFIVNNGPYSAHYEPNFSKDMEEGTYVLLAFLSRSYHESVKNPDAFWVDAITVGEPAETMDVDLAAPHMFYSRPKGTYAGADTKKLMLDFYLLNTSIGPNGNKVRATVNGTEFMIDEWAPYYIENLPLGEVQIKMELLDADGNPIPGPFNTVERTVTLTE